MQINTDIYGSVTAVILTVVSGVALWVRQERVSNSKDTEIIAATNTSTIRHEGQAEELIVLRQEVSELRKAFVAQAAIVAQQQQQIAVLQASHLGVSTHFGNLLLCDSCQEANKKLLVALEKAIEKSIESYVQEARELNTPRA